MPAEKMLTRTIIPNGTGQKKSEGNQFFKLAACGKYRPSEEAKADDDTPGS
jgi:hypothetical protein